MSMDTHDQRSRIQHAIAHLEHVLPAQASIRDFVHHNTLHGFQHLPFPDALRAARELTGIRGYPPEAFFRERFAAGRIARAAHHAVAHPLRIAADERLGEHDDRRAPCRGLADEADGLVGAGLAIEGNRARLDDGGAHGGRGRRQRHAGIVHPGARACPAARGASRTTPTGGDRTAPGQAAPLILHSDIEIAYHPPP